MPPERPFYQPVTDEAINAYTAYVKERLAAGQAWKRSSEILPTLLRGEPFDVVVGDNGFDGKFDG